MIGVKDRFGESGSPEMLMKEFGLDEHAIFNTVMEMKKTV